MDDKELAQFKGKFTVCVLLLNVIIFCAAAAVLFWFIPPSTWEPKIFVVIACAAISLIALAAFIPKYKSTKAWLDIHGTTKEERLAKLKAEKEQERERIRAELRAEMLEEDDKSNGDDK
ncbi:MAG: hypothetical protein Q4Q53_04190 [Methanocorpusculum sp.]|nr:hypothetical protein [Methanocorpusculum sp.]